MKIATACPQCLALVDNGDNSIKLKLIQAEIDNNFSVKTSCEYGHSGIIIYKERKYRLLIKSAVMAFAMGFTNEAVAMMSTALERAYEFYVRVS